MATNAVDVEAELDKMFWKSPAVMDASTLVSPFFSTKALPRNFSKPYVPYVLSAFTQLSQLTHEVAVNAPIHGSSANLVLRDFLIFHIERIVEAGFDDPTFMKSLRPARASDLDAVQKLGMLKTAGSEFSTRWHTAQLAEKNGESRRVMKQCWAAAKSAADVISKHMLSFEDAEARVVLNLPWWRVADIFTTEGRFPTKLIVTWLWWGVGVAMMLDVFVWLIWHDPRLWMPIVATVVCTTGFGGFLIFFYTLTRRNTVASWYANMLSRNLALEHYKQREGKTTCVGEQDLEFFIGANKTNHPRKLTLNPSVINHQVVMIGITNVTQLRICSWNFSARLATSIRSGDAIGKSLEVMIDPESTPVVQTMFNELKQRGKSGQHRLLFNSIGKGKVPIRASATIACVDGSPIGMIVGTVIEEEERAVMTYFSRAGASALLDHLKDVHQIDDPTTTALVLANSFELLKERTTNAIRNWRSTEKDELIDLLQHPNAGGVRPTVHCADSVPSTFQCDYMQTEHILSVVFNGLQNASPDKSVSVTLSFHGSSLDRTGGTTAATMLQVVLETELPCCIPLTLEASLQDAVRNVGYLVQLTERSVRLLFPVTPTAITGAGGPTEAVMYGPPAVASQYTFLMHEPDSVYLSHLNSYCSRQQHRCFTVPTVAELEKMLDRLGAEVSGVILASCSPCFDAMLKVCQQYNTFVVVTKVELNRGGGLFATTFGGPPLQSTDFHYMLTKPVQEREWQRFLNYLRDYRRHQNSLQAPMSHECKLIKNISSSSSSSVDLVRDIVTGGVMARKTIFMSNNATTATLVMNEVDILRYINGNPYVIRYISSTSPSRREFCLFFQYCKYGTLASLAREQVTGHLDLPQLALFAKQLLCALKYVHSKGVAHRDVKPQNVMLSSPEHLQLADFGSATRDPTMAGSTRGGTFRYMAPERFVVVETPLVDTGNVAVEVFTEDAPSSAAQNSVSMAPLYAEDLWSTGLTLLDVAGAYPAALEGLQTTDDYLAVYGRYRDEQKGIEVELATSLSSDESMRSDAADFLQQLLRFKPLDRTPAAQLLSHRFLDKVTWNTSPLEEQSAFLQEDFLPANVLHGARFHPQNSCGSVFTIGDEAGDDDSYGYDD